VPKNVLSTSDKEFLARFTTVLKRIAVIYIEESGAGIAL
jgi:hypothetical protein